MPARTVVFISVLSLLGLTESAGAQAPSPGKDLKATIVLHGYPCDAVASSQRNADSDYTATCKDGNRYHVFVDRAGRVIVKKL
jgi:hypothetical protein